MTNLSSFIYSEENDRLNPTSTENSDLNHDPAEHIENKSTDEDKTVVKMDSTDDDAAKFQDTIVIYHDRLVEEEQQSILDVDTHIAQNTVSIDETNDESDVENTEQEIEQETTPDLNKMKPGEQLRYLREQKGFSAQQVADRLYLSLHIIQGIEADDYKNLPPSIFVRGYFRNYAKLLEIKAEPLLEAYTHLTGDKSLPPLTPQVKQKEQTKSTDSWVKAVTITVAIVCMALMALWRIYPDPSVNVPDESVDLNNPEGESVTLPLQPFTPIPLSEQATEGDFTPPLEGGVEGDEPVGTQPLVGIPVEPTTTTTSENPTTSMAATTETVTTVTVPVDPRTMTLHYQQDSWTRITDKDNKRVYEGIPKAGESISVTGEPPFKLRFGVVDGITAEYKGQKIVLSESENRNGRSIIVGEAITESATTTGQE